MALALAGIEDIIQFARPAYTYVLKFPYAHWQRDEVRLQNALGWPHHDLLRDPLAFTTMPGQDCPTEQATFLETRGPQYAYALLLARSAHSAAYSIFSQKQGKCPPAASVYVQCELGEKYLHVHVVMGGDGLNKYNAKATCSQLGYKWLDNMQAQIELNVKNGHNTDLDMCNVLIHEIYQAKHKCFDSRSDVCTILQYKCRNGEMYACRVDPIEFICNYLLPKNLKYFAILNYERATPTTAFFPCTTKTYAATFINGKWIMPHLRKQWINALRDTVCQKMDPVFAGDMFEDLPKVPKSTWSADSSTANKSKITKKESLMIDCIDRCEKNHYLTYEDLVNGCTDLVIMLESQPGGSKLIENLLHMVHIKICQKFTAYSYIKARYSAIDLLSSNKAWQLLVYQGYNPWQVGHWLCCFLHKTAGKQNTVSFYGPASTGKTNFAKAIVNAVKLYGCVNHQNKNFVFNDCAAKLINWWEECLMHTDWVEQAKCLLGGTEFRIDRKHKDSQLLPQTPLVISTNNDIYTVVGGNTTTMVHSKPLRERIVQFNFMKQLPATFGEIDANDVVAIIQACSARFEITLAAFYNQWNLSKTPNDFPLTTFCAGHSQDFVLHEVGLCNTCGGFIPLETRDRSQPEPASRVKSGEHTFIMEDLTWGCNKAFSDCMLSSAESSVESTPEKTFKRPASPRPSTSAGEPAAKRQVRRNIQFTNNWNSQPDNRLDQIKYERFVESILYSPQPETSESESEPESNKKGLTPSEWGELLGIITSSLEEEPVVLHCFESLSDVSETEDDTDGSVQPTPRKNKD
nr:MAG: nonstructural protein 1 [Canine parvovirus]